ncbi:lipoyl(octanoyl) transferase LipB [Saprospiraceae bacterium]|nr:lipoyl(octanoyl) transferase LipB [Saprospiraceae bacterium]
MITQRHDISFTSYKKVWDFQSLLHEDIKKSKIITSRTTNKNKSNKKYLNHVVFCEHNKVITLGKSAKNNNLLTPRYQLENDNIEIFNINRGGDITYHGPGQLTGYLIFDLELLYRDIHKYVRNIEECIILLLKRYGLHGERHNDFTGVWINDKKGFRKICAIGVHLSRWVSMHGFGFNINTDLSQFNHIIPCGIDEQNMSVTSLSNELGEDQDIKLIKNQLQEIMIEVYHLEFI